ncbi:MAG: flagellar export chaperone FliS [Armatimonadota bacterium]
MAALSANLSYQSNQVTTVSRGQLLVLAYDGMLRFLHEGKRAMQQHNYEAQNVNLTKTQALLTELLRTLDHAINPQLADNLDRLYRYMYDRLTTANVHDDSAAVDEITHLISELREAWVEAEAKCRQDNQRHTDSGGFAA